MYPGRGRGLAVAPLPRPSYQVPSCAAPQEGEAWDILNAARKRAPMLQSLGTIPGPKSARVEEIA